VARRSISGIQYGDLPSTSTARSGMVWLRLVRQGFLKPRVKPRISATKKGTGESVAISALLEPTSGLLRSPVTKSPPSLTSPTVAHRCSSPPSPRAQAAQAPEPRTTSRIPMVRMSSVSVPDPGEKIRLGARIIVAPTATRAAATSAKIQVDAWALSRITARPYSRCVFRQPASALPDGQAVDWARDKGRPDLRLTVKDIAPGSQPCDSSPMTRTVAVIGAGPGGLIAARWLLSQGFEPTIFEQGPKLGGQWTGLVGRSGVWPAMHTNTSRIMTAFSDLEHESDVVYPSNREILDYLQRYADTFGLTSRIRFGDRVELLRRDDARWLVGHADLEESFERVVVASGRFHAPAIPPVPGLDTFAGSAGAISTYHYRGPAPYQGKRVLVAGCAISALEIAAELAQVGAARVVVTQRRQR